MTRKIEIKTLEEVKDFVSKVYLCPYDVDMLSGRYVIDAKSIMGIFSLDLEKPLSIEIHGEACEEFLAAIEPYIIR